MFHSKNVVMKVQNNTLFFIVISFLLISCISCEEYLDRTDYADITEDDIFSNYNGFQGFVDGLYVHTTMLLGVQGPSMDLADDAIGNFPDSDSYRFPRGDYYWLWTTHNWNTIFRTGGGAWEKNRMGFWDDGWKGIRRANLGLENYPLLVDATSEERNLLLGQLYFFRAWYHYWIAVNWGGIPYIDELLDPSDNLMLPRLSFEETLLRVAQDFAMASKYLPWDWNETTQGLASPDANFGRVTKGAALGMKSRTYLYLSSPWIEGLKTGIAGNYNVAYADSAARAAIEVINSNRYRLLEWDDYSYNFAWTNNKDERYSHHSIIESDEIIMQRMSQNHINNDKYLRKGNWTVLHILSRTHYPLRLCGYGTGQNTSATQSFIDMYDAADGYPINDPDGSVYDPENPWENRDPRLLKTILLDGTLWRNIGSLSEEEKRVQTYSYGGEDDQGGLDIASANPVLTGYIIRKYLAYQAWANPAGPGFNQMRVTLPFLRLAEMYLNYAEAVNEIGGPNATLSGETLTALEAVNTIRRRVKLPVNEDISLPWELNEYGNASLPDIPVKFHNKTDLRERIRNERSIELAFESHRWFDIRRWFIAHTLDKRILKGRFDKDHTTFETEVLGTRIFDYPKHYLLPFNRNDVFLYEEFTQNPGWE
jgi:starch-binding outer membrane protein, SusD/RagB family